MTTINAFLLWLHDKGKDHKTIAAYKTIVTRFCKWYFDSTGNADLNSVKPIDAKLYLSSMRHNKIENKQQSIKKLLH